MRTLALLAALLSPSAPAPAPRARPAPAPAWAGRWQWGPYEVTLDAGGGYEARCAYGPLYLGWWRAEGGLVVVEEWPAGEGPETRREYRLLPGPGRTLAHRPAP